jgi:small-conductance mechanosensitive channel
MWFEQLIKEAEESNPGEAISALYGIIYYYFISVCFMGLIWILWQVMELRLAVTYNLALVAGSFGLMAVVIDGLRKLKSWARVLLMANYLGLIGAAVVGLILSGRMLMTEVTPGTITAVLIYLLVILLSGYGIYLFSSPGAKKLNWR